MSERDDPIELLRTTSASTWTTVLAVLRQEISADEAVDLFYTNLEALHPDEKLHAIAERNHPSDPKDETDG